MNLGDSSVLRVSSLEDIGVMAEEPCQGALARALIGMNIRKWHGKQKSSLPASRARMPSSQLVSCGLRR